MNLQEDKIKDMNCKIDTKLAALIVVLVLTLSIFLATIFKINIVQFLKNLFMLEYLPKLGNNTSYILLFTFGILTSFHCIGMCGGINISQTISKTGNVAQNSAFRPALLYNIGRIISYTIIGGIVGGLGGIIGFPGMLRGIVPIVGGIFMVIMAINLLGVFKVLRRVNITVPSFFAKKIHGNNNYSPVIVGLLTGLMPCGPIQIVEIYALGTRSVILGSASMFFFSIGTVPLMFMFGILNTILTKNFSKIILKVSAVLVLCLGMAMIGRGLSLYGVSVGMKNMPYGNDKGVSVIEGRTQNVKTELGSDSFTPIEVIKGIPVKWNLHVDKKNLNECNKAIQIPEYNVKKNLKVGDNIIEFTPDRGGEFVYTCWMGMIKSKITVVDSIDQLKQDKTEN
ncbi:urease accessory protein UreH domain-containing protein [Clostridium sp. LBM24168]